jgi:hypothetical protein
MCMGSARAVDRHKAATKGNQCPFHTATDRMVYKVAAVQWIANSRESRELERSVKDI